MVCDSCAAKLAKTGASTMACTDVFKPSKSSAASGVSGSGAGGGRVIGENKLLSSKRKYAPYMMADRPSKPTASGSGKKAAEPTMSGCRDCGQNTVRPTAKLCRDCSFKSGACSECGRQTLSQKVKSISRMSAK